MYRAATSHPAGRLSGECEMCACVWEVGVGFGVLTRNNGRNYGRCLADAFMRCRPQRTR